MYYVAVVYLDTTNAWKTPCMQYYAQCDFPRHLQSYEHVYVGSTIFVPQYL